MYNTVCLCHHVAVLRFHEEWMCFGMQRNTHITGNNLIPISVPINYFVDGSYMYTQQKRDDCYDNSIWLFQLHVLLIVCRLLCKIDKHASTFILSCS